MTEAEAMSRALSLAWRGWGRVHPNPLVGAVVLRDGVIVGEGWHAEFGGPHAERVALQQAGDAARGATLVVTLSPCQHHGKQPPCTDAIIDAGIARVVIALDDPNPEAAGGTRLLAAAGIAVELGLASDMAAAQNAAFLHRHRNVERPWVALKLATSVDGRIADSTGRSQWISGDAAREWVHWLRAGFDAIAVGAGTVAKDDPSLTVRGAVTPRKVPLRVVVDDALTTTADSRVVDTAGEAPTLILTSAARAASPAAAALARARVTVLPMHDLADGLHRLREHGVERLLVEGGARLAGALLSEGLVDRFYHVQSPVWLGDHAREAFVGIGDTVLAEAPRWRVVEQRALGQDTLVVMDRP
ncbi:MAG TPA: bifunctional diaminohydroxyphosphoribosylaminopyrimidine deaminase/5-amino-6-(5-phosphoribosylamino)uracil reductase RibD [Gemmatimonadales bacterium]|nr:bifunctional diaminohydroxyphosphoribosylaminopyrimidine deaminase/5-amino-6-(5-phosphoribosylamino)uracil reductase RibD [Gemmatimonadales bacterium]